jgi:NhaA family Na+:H+ antiporter
MYSISSWRCSSCLTPGDGTTDVVNVQRLTEPVTADDHVQGPADASVTLVQYSDYQCPYTRLSRLTVHALQREYPDQLRFVFRHFPLEAIHPRARDAAAAAEAAGRQVAQRIDRDLSSGEASGVDGTPTFYVNGTRHDGGYDLDDLRPAILAHLRGKARQA